MRSAMIEDKPRVSASGLRCIPPQRGAQFPDGTCTRDEHLMVLGFPGRLGISHVISAHYLDFSNSSFSKNSTLGEASSGLERD